VLEWLTSKVMTTAVVLVIAVSFLGLFGMQVDHYRTLELEDIANRVSELVTEVDLVLAEVTVEVNWTGASESMGIPRTFYGEPYLIEFTSERPYVVLEGERVKGRHFPGIVQLRDRSGEQVDILEIPSTTGFLLQSSSHWTDDGLDRPITIMPLP
jgi:hypothetical protein